MSLKRCYALAVGVLKIDPEYFLHKMSLEAFNLALEAYTENSRTAWYQVRVLSYWAAVANMKDQKFKNFCRFSMPFSWEETAQRQKPTEKETEQYMQILKKVLDGQK